MKLILACVGLALLFSAPASAAPFTWLISGTIASLSDFPPASETPIGSLLTLGDPFTMTLTFESSSPDFDPNPHCGLYSPLTSTQFVSGQANLSSNDPGRVVTRSAAYNPAVDRTCLATVPDGQLRTTASGGGVTAGFSFDFWRPGLTSDALVTDPAGLFTTSLDIFPYSFQSGGIATGRITSIKLVPEPTTLSLVGVGLVGSWRRRRRLRLGGS